MKFLSLLILTLFLSYGLPASAQVVAIDPIVKKDDKGEINGCGIEVAASNGKASGIQAQIILYSLGNLNWDMAVHMVVGHVEDDKEFTQEKVDNASLINNTIGEIRVIKGGKLVLKETLENRDFVASIHYMLRDGFTFSFQTEALLDGAITIPPQEEALRRYNDECYAIMAGALREQYRSIHGDTKCLDDPAGC